MAAWFNTNHKSLRMKIALNILLACVSIVLIYLLVESIRKPINFKETREIREQMIRERLKQTAELQKVYKSLTKKYAESYDSLKHVLMNDTFLIDQAFGDKFDTNQVVSVIKIKLPAKDSLRGIIKKNAPNPKMTIEEYFKYLRIVPFSGGQEFYMKTSEAIVEGTDSLMAPTFEAGTTIGSYLPEFDSASHVIYDPEFNPNNLRKVGDLYKPSTTGNW
jgi:hypothetical protein